MCSVEGVDGVRGGVAMHSTVLALARCSYVLCECLFSVKMRIALVMFLSLSTLSLLGSEEDNVCKVNSTAR